MTAPLNAAAQGGTPRTDATMIWAKHNPPSTIENLARTLERELVALDKDYAILERKYSEACDKLTAQREAAEKAAALFFNITNHVDTSQTCSKHNESIYLWAESGKEILDAALAPQTPDTKG